MTRGITENDVWQAADALLLDGARPTIERVRQKLGRGSPNTVGPHLDGWFRSLGARLQGGSGKAGSSALPEAVQQAALQLWSAALDSVRAELEADFASRREALESERAELAGDRVRLQTESEHMAARQQGLEAALQAVHARLDEAQRQQERLERQLETRQQEAEALRGEAVASRELAGRLAAQLETQRRAHEVERDRLEERAVAHEKRWALELDRARDALKQAQARLSGAEAESAKRIAQLAEAGERLEGELREARAEGVHRRHEAESLGLQLDQARQALSETREAALRRTQELSEREQRLQSLLDQTAAQLRARDEEHAALLRSLAEAGLRSKARRRGASE